MSDVRQHGSRPAPVELAAFPGTYSWNRFIGRRRELAELPRLMRMHRLVTLVGPPGVGKTRLAYEVATKLGGRSAGDAVLVELAPVLDPSLVPQAVAGAFGLENEPGVPVIDAVAAALSGAKRLLVLDNCEHLADACAGLVEMLLASCPRLMVLATSRELLRVAGEASYPVAGLPLPRLDSTSNVLRSDAVQLFIDRFREHTGSAPGSADSRSVAELCVRLDGMPLAIELAAATAKSMSVPAVLARLDDQLTLFTAGSSSADPRHRSLRATIEWSYAQLTPHEQAMFRYLSVFDGGFCLAAATAMCAGTGLAARGALPLVLGLGAKSVILPTHTPHGERFRMLEPVRLYGRERLRAWGEEDPAYDRLANWLTELSQPIFEGVASAEAARAVVEERINLQHVLERMSQGDDDRQLPLAYSLASGGASTFTIGHTRYLLERALKNTSVESPYRGRALDMAGRLAAADGDRASAVRFAGKAVDVARRRGDTAELGQRLLGLGRTLLRLADMSGAEDVFRECVQTAWYHGDGATRLVALSSLAWIALARNEVERATRHLDEAMPLIILAPDPTAKFLCLHTAAAVALECGDLVAAHTYLLECLGTALEQPTQVPAAVEGLAIHAFKSGQPERALRLAIAATSLRGEDTTWMDPWWSSQVEGVATAARAALGEGRADAVDDIARRLTSREIIAYARDDLLPHQPPPTDPGLLSPRQWQVARLVTRGMTNVDIAAAIGTSVRTVDAHVRDICARLGMQSRAQIAAWLAQRADVVEPDMPSEWRRGPR